MGRKDYTDRLEVSTSNLQIVDNTVINDVNNLTERSQTVGP